MQKLTIQERGTDRLWMHECLEEIISIGRMEDNVVCLESDSVSRQHAKIVREGENFFVIDLKSGNGTLLNGIPLRSSQKHLLKTGDHITIDVFDLHFQENDSSGNQFFEEEVTNSDILEVKLLKKVLTSLDKEMVPSIEALNGAAEGKKIFLTDEVGEIVIGRDPECDFPVNEYVISRKHARIIKRWGGIAIRDLESKNGTFLNNRRVVEEYLHDGDRVALGTIIFLFRNPQEINLAPFEHIKSKNRPAQVSPQEIPGIEKESELSQPDELESPPERESGGEQEEVSAIEEWDKLEKSISKIEPYPTPQPNIEAIKRLTPVEIGMIGLGALVIILALVMIVNLLAS